MSTIKPRTTSVVIYQGDDLERLGELRREAEIAQRAVDEAADKPRRMGDAPTAQAERDAYDAFVEEAAERATVIEIRSIGRKRFRDLLADHPPRMVKDAEGKDVTHEDDSLFEVNMETFPDALLTYVSGDVRTIVAPTFPTSTDLREFVDNDLAYGDFDRLFTTAYMLNKAEGVDPKGTRYSSGIRSSDVTSR